MNVEFRSFTSLFYIQHSLFDINSSYAKFYFFAALAFLTSATVTADALLPKLLRT